jgi:hypothetical protein
VLVGWVVVVGGSDDLGVGFVEGKIGSRGALEA